MKRDITKQYPLSQFIAKLRRLADCLEADEGFSIQIEKKRVYIPTHARYTIEHEASSTDEEIEFQISWKKEQE